MWTFELSCMKLTADNQPAPYSVLVEVEAVGQTNGPDRYRASAPGQGLEWGHSDSYPDPRTAALQLAYSNAASVRDCKEVGPRLLAYVYAYEYEGRWMRCESQQTTRSRQCSDERGETMFDHAADMGDLYECGTYCRDEGDHGARLYMQV